MVKHGTIERLRRRGETTGGAPISLARASVATGMIMRKDDAGTAVLCRIKHDVAQGEVCESCVAVVPANVQATCLLVDMRDPQAFAGRVRIGNAAREKGAGGDKAVELERRFGTLIAHAATLPAAALADDRNRVEPGPLFLRFGES